MAMGAPTERHLLRGGGTPLCCSSHPGGASHHKMLYPLYQGPRQHTTRRSGKGLWGRSCLAALGVRSSDEAACIRAQDGSDVWHAPDVCAGVHCLCVPLWLTKAVRCKEREGETEIVLGAEQETVERICCEMHYARVGHMHVCCTAATLAWQAMTTHALLAGLVF